MVKFQNKYIKTLTAFIICDHKILYNKLTGSCVHFNCDKYKLNFGIVYDN
jgi:hypothetical protein